MENPSATLSPNQPQFLTNYHKEATASLKECPDNIGLIFGNTSVDMDSAIGSIVMAWYYGTVGEVKTSDGKKIVYKPVINCPE